MDTETTPIPVADVPGAALGAAMSRAVDEDVPVSSNQMARVLAAAAPALYRAWGEVLVRRIREEGAKDAAPSEGYDGPLLDAMLFENGGGYFEDCDPQRMADGAANWIASLLGLDGKDHGRAVRLGESRP